MPYLGQPNLSQRSRATPRHSESALPRPSEPLLSISAITSQSISNANVAIRDGLSCPNHASPFRICPSYRLRISPHLIGHFFPHGACTLLSSRSPPHPCFPDHSITAYPVVSWTHLPYPYRPYPSTSNDTVSIHISLSGSFRTRSRQSLPSLTFQSNTYRSLPNRPGRSTSFLSLPQLRFLASRYRNRTIRSCPSARCRASLS